MGSIFTGLGLASSWDEQGNSASASLPRAMPLAGQPQETAAHEINNAANSFNHLQNQNRASAHHMAQALREEIRQRMLQQQAADIEHAPADVNRAVEVRQGNGRRASIDGDDSAANSATNAGQGGQNDQEAGQRSRWLTRLTHTVKIAYPALDLVASTTSFASNFVPSGIQEKLLKAAGPFWTASGCSGIVFHFMRDGTLWGVVPYVFDATAGSTDTGATFLSYLKHPNLASIEGLNIVSDVTWCASGITEMSAAIKDIVQLARRGDHPRLNMVYAGKIANVVGGAFHTAASVASFADTLSGNSTALADGFWVAASVSDSLATGLNYLSERPSRGNDVENPDISIGLETVSSTIL